MNLDENMFVGLIADGNRTWALEHFQKESKDQLTSDELYEAYHLGGERVKQAAERAREEGVAIFSAWGGSMKNLSGRPKREVGVLHAIYEHFLTELRDVWMDKEGNRDVRFVHMGRTERIQHYAPQVMTLIREIDEHTRQRAGMVMAVCLDYDGLDERDRAIQQWAQQGGKNSPAGWLEHLDLPRQGVKFQPVNLILRTSVDPPKNSVYDNEYLHSYQNETRVRACKACLPDFTADMFSGELAKYRAETKREGK